MRKYDVSVELIKQRYYKEGKSQQLIADELGISQWVISDRMIKSGLERLSKTRNFNPRKYEINHNAFTKFNKQTAWLIGWMVSDGFIGNNGRFGLKVSVVDRDILSKLRNYLEYTGPIYHHEQILSVTGRTYYQASLQPTSRKIVNRLKEFGIIPNKSLSICFPELISRRNEDIIRPFIRGVFEGDGSFLMERRGSLLFQIAGTHELCEGIQKQLIKFLPVRKTKLTHNIKNSNHYALRYRGKFQVMKIMDWLYHDAGHEVLNRKYDRYLLVKGKII